MKLPTLLQPREPAPKTTADADSSLNERLAAIMRAGLPPSEEARAALGAIEAELGRRRIDVDRLYSARRESLLSAEPLHLRVCREAELEVEHLREVAQAWCEEVKQREADDARAREPYEIILGPGGWWRLVDRDTGRFVHARTFATKSEARAWMGDVAPAPAKEEPA